jgi:hypothetical protein
MIPRALERAREQSPGEAHGQEARTGVDALLAGHGRGKWRRGGNATDVTGRAPLLASSVSPKQNHPQDLLTTSSAQRAAAIALKTMSLARLILDRPVFSASTLGLFLLVIGQPAGGSDIFTGIGARLVTIGVALAILPAGLMYVFSHVTDVQPLALLGGTAAGLAAALGLDELWRQWRARRRSRAAG